jgi:hypothetical protein
VIYHDENLLGGVTVSSFRFGQSANPPKLRGNSAFAAHSRPEHDHSVHMVKLANLDYGCD